MSVTPPIAATTAAPARILVVEDDPGVRDAVVRVLSLEGHTVNPVGTGFAALAQQDLERADVIVLDLGLPDLDGLDVCERLRKTGDDTPVLVLTARDAVEDRVAGLDAGADDYLVKPFAVVELAARVRALARRRPSMATTTGTPGTTLRFGYLSLDPATWEVRTGETAIELTRTEFSLLELFLRNPRQVLPRAVIFERVWGFDFGPQSNALEVYIGYLRRKTEIGEKPRLIHTVRGVGYQLKES